METGRFRLHADFTDLSVIEWYHAATVGDLALVEILSRDCVVELRCCTSGRVLWSLRGGRSMTMPLADALSRLQLLSIGKPCPGRSEAGTGQGRVAAETVLLETV